MKTPFKIVLIISTILFSLFILLILLLPSIVDLTKYKNKIEGFIEEAIKRDVSIREIRVSILKGIGAELRDIKIGKDPDLIDIEDMRIKVALLPLLQKKIEMKGVSLNNIKVFLKSGERKPKMIMISHLYLPLTSYKSGIAEVRGIEADLYKGIFMGDLRVEKGEKETIYSLIHNAEKIEVEPLIKDAIGSKVTISGHLKLEGNLKGMGDNLESLEGSGSLNIGKGRIKGFDIGELIGTIGKITYKRPVSLSEYERISGHYKIGDGYLRTDDLEMVGKDLYFKAKGSYGLTNSRLDFLIAGSIIDIPVEIKIGGTSSKPAYQIKLPGAEKKILKELGKEIIDRKTGKKGIGKIFKEILK